MSRSRALRRRFLRALERADLYADPESPLPVSEEEAAVLRSMYGAPPRLLADRRALFIMSIDEEVVAVLEQVVARLARTGRAKH